MSANEQPAAGGSPGRLIILEGPDGGGKSTLAQQLCRYYSAEYHHEGPPPPEVALLDYYGAILENARKLGGNHVFDRLAYGELVYGPIFRGVDRLGRNGWLVFNQWIKTANAVKILCLPPYQDAHQNWMHRKGIEMVTDHSQYHRIYWEYADHATDHHYVYDYTKANATTKLLSFLEKCQ